MSEHFRVLVSDMKTNQSPFKKKISNGDLFILGSPNIRELLVVGGMKVDDQIRALEAGVDIVVATPGK